MKGVLVRLNLLAMLARKILQWPVGGPVPVVAACSLYGWKVQYSYTDLLGLNQPRSLGTSALSAWINQQVFLNRTRAVQTTNRTERRPQPSSILAAIPPSCCFPPLLACPVGLRKHTTMAARDIAPL